MSKGVVIDARWLRTGIGRYTRSLLHGLKRQLSELPITCIVRPEDAGLVSRFCDRVIECNAGIYGVREQLEVPWLAREASAFYAPHYNIPLLWRRRLLVTIHDLNHLLDSTYRHSWKSKLYARPLIRTAVERADVIITPSEYTRTNLAEHLKVNPTRVLVIPCCVAAPFQVISKEEAKARVARQLGVTRPYILFVGNCGPSKNVSLLLDAVSRLKARRKDAPLLVMAGEACRWRPRMQAYARNLGLVEGVEWVNKVSDVVLADLYAASLMTVMPSLEEGFGLPVIESMACGTPVICSQAASLPEVAGDAAVLFSPDSCGQLVEAMEKVLDSTHTQQMLIAAGLRRATHFSQERFDQSQAAAIRELALAPAQLPGSIPLTAR